MAITDINASFLCEAKRAGASFRHLMTLGRQNFYMKRRSVNSFAKEYGVDINTERLVYGGYADDFLRAFLGVEDLVAIDNSDFEGAQIVHDMNVPLPASMEQTVDAVLEAGALEHVFNFPVAIANCMRAVRCGGRVFFGAPANNQFGHGFYQFSPELFYRCLSEGTGFEVERLLAVEMRSFGEQFGTYGKGYEVVDPAKIGTRVTLVSSRPVSLLIQARKTRHLSAPFERPPQQSDYARAWQAATAPSEVAGSRDARPIEPGRSALRRIARMVPAPIRQAIAPPVMSRYSRWFVHTLRNRRFYTPVK